MKFRTKKAVLAAQDVDPADEQKVYRELPGKIRVLERAHPVATVLKLLANVRVLYAMIRDSDFKLSLKSKAIIIAGLLYFVLPFDAVPDYIPVLGYIDDGVVISAVLRMLVKEVDAYRAFAVQNTKSSVLATS